MKMNASTDKSLSKDEVYALTERRMSELERVLTENDIGFEQGEAVTFPELRVGKGVIRGDKVDLEYEIVINYDYDFGPTFGKPRTGQDEFWVSTDTRTGHVLFHSKHFKPDELDELVKLLKSGFSLNIRKDAKRAA